MVKGKTTSTPRCPVCSKSAGGGTFECVTCLQWVHPRCGGYKARYVQDQNTDPATLQCLKCQNVVDVEDEEDCIEKKVEEECMHTETSEVTNTISVSAEAEL